MNIILDALTENYVDWEVFDSYARKDGETYTAVIQMMMGFIRTGIYHRGFGIWEQDHHNKNLNELKKIVHGLNDQLVIANENPYRYINGVMSNGSKTANYMETN